MRILTNMLVASGRKTGIGHYATELLRCLSNRPDVERVEEFPSSWLRWCWGKCNGMRSQMERPNKKPAARTKSTWRQAAVHSLRGIGSMAASRQLRRLVNKGGYDLYHEPNYIPLYCDLPTIATVHDLSILLHPEWHPADRVRYFEKNFEQALEQCVHFLAISEFGRQEIIRTFNVPPECVSLTYMGVRPGLAPLTTEETTPILKQLGLPPQYLLYLGTIEPRKNLMMLMKAYCSLPDNLRRDWPLLVVGGWGWNTDKVRSYLETEARHRGVIHLGYVPDQFINVLYNAARALVYPSFYEGFGLPPVEMMACGGAVLASTAGALIEVTGNRAHLIPPNDQDGWREAMQMVVEDDGWWRMLREGVEQAARPFTWEQCASATASAFHKALGRIRPTSQQLKLERAA